MASRDMLYYLGSVGKCLGSRGWAKEAYVMVIDLGEKLRKEGVFGFFWKLPDVLHDIGKPLTQSLLAMRSRGADIDSTRRSTSDWAVVLERSSG